jgi:hypothetical protein
VVRLGDGDERQCGAHEAEALAGHGQGRGGAHHEEREGGGEDAALSDAEQRDGDQDGSACNQHPVPSRDESARSVIISRGSAREATSRGATQLPTMAIREKMDSSSAACAASAPLSRAYWGR